MITGFGVFGYTMAMDYVIDNLQPTPLPARA